MLLRLLSIAMVVCVIPSPQHASEWVQDRDFSPQQSCVSLYESSEMRAFALDLNHTRNDRKPGSPEPLTQKMVRLDKIRVLSRVVPQDENKSAHVSVLLHVTGNFLNRSNMPTGEALASETDLCDVNLDEETPHVNGGIPMFGALSAPSAKS